MKVIVVEPDKQVARKMMRMLQAVDGSIQVIGVLAGMNALLKWVETQILPDLVLINRTLLNHVQQPVEAKLIIPGGRSPLVYLAYRVNNLKYLEKHILKNKTLLSGEIAADNLLANSISPVVTTTPHIPIKKRFLVTHQQKYLSIPVEEISYFFSDNRFIFFVTFTNKKYLVEYRIDELETLLNKEDFFRINRAYLISIRSISLIQPYPGNRFRLTLNPAADKEIIVSRERLPAFRTWLGE
jgi:two-component system response regulator LytT